MRSNRAAQLRLVLSVDADPSEDYSQKMKRNVAVDSTRRTSRPPRDRRAAFLERLSDRLENKSYSLVNGEFGREAKRGVWMLTLELPNHHVVTLRAPLAANDDPFGEGVCDDIVGRVIAHLSK